MPYDRLTHAAPSPDSAVEPADPSAGSVADGASGVTVEFDAEATMRDGAVLRADVYRPRGTGPWPTLLTRAPYGKTLPTVLGWLDPVHVARRGFMVVVQDTRGRYASEGDWEPFRFERRDGYDSVEWAARLPGSNGRVGMYGASYFGNTQWLAALEQPPALVGIAPALTWAEPMDGLFARGGAVELGLALAWSLEVGFDYVGRLGLTDADLSGRVAGLIDEYDRLSHDGYWELPVRAGTAIRRHGVPELGSLRALAEPEVADWTRIAGSQDRVRVPSFHLGGWHDIFLQGTLDNYQAAAGSDVDTRLIVGPWTHGGFADPIGEQLYGLRAGKNGIPVHPHGDVNDLQLAWFRRQLGPDPGVELPESPVRLFVMGRNVWRDERSWPPTRPRRERWFLRPAGSLAAGHPGPCDSSSEFIYDPMNPVPTVGGHILMSPGYPAGPLDQTRIARRPDVLVFTSEPLEDDLEILGHVRAILYAETSAPSTDWVLRLCDVYPDGRSLNLCDGILRVTAAARETCSHEIDLWSTCNVFLRGHRISLHVTSSSFPRWDRNLNTGDQSARRHVVARQRIYHDADRPSHIELPVVP